MLMIPDEEPPGIAVMPTLFEQDALERSTEILVKNRVNHRIKGGITISQPEGERETPTLDTTR